MEKSKEYLQNWCTGNEGDEWVKKERVIEYKNLCLKEAIEEIKEEDLKTCKDKLEEGYVTGIRTAIEILNSKING